MMKPRRLLSILQPNPMEGLHWLDACSIGMCSCKGAVKYFMTVQGPGTPAFLLVPAGAFLFGSLPEQVSPISGRGEQGGQGSSGRVFRV